MQADRQRFLGAGRVLDFGRRSEQVGGEDGSLAGLAGGLVEDFQGRDHRPARVVFEGVEVSTPLVGIALLPGLGVPFLG